MFFSVFAQLRAPYNIIKTYMARLSFMVLKFLPCSKTDNARATNEVLMGWHSIINALKVNGKSVMKKIMFAMGGH